MNRREWIKMGGATALTGVQASAWQATPYPGVSYRAYSKCLPEFLRELALAAHRNRAEAIAKIMTPEALAERKKWARQTFWSLTGEAPDRSPLNARTTGSFVRIGYRVDKVIFESRPGFHVTGNLYVPTRGRGPWPGVLVQMGHAPEGKAYPAYQRLCQGLVKLGFVVFGFDPMGQGERAYYPDQSGRRSRKDSVDEEHSTAGWQMLLTGDTATRLQTWDAIRALDYLAGRPFVDRARLGVTGQSGGATNSMMLMAADDRIAVAALSCPNSENFACAGYTAPGSTDDAEQNFLDAAAAGFDRWDMLWPFAGKPLLISVSDKDFFGTYSPQYIESGWTEFNLLRKQYELLGKADHLAWCGTPLPHSLAYDSRMQIYNWFLRWLKNEPRPLAEEPPVQTEAEESLWVTEAGSTIKSLSSLTPHQMNKRRLGRQTPAPLDRLLRIDRPPSGTYSTLKRVSARGVEIEALDIPSAAHVSLPAWLFLPKPPRTVRSVMIILDSNGRNADWHEGELYQSLALQGFGVCVPDVRGIGDLLPEVGAGNPRYTKAHSEEEAYAWAGLMLGRPMLGQRTTDILAVVRAVKAHPALQNKSLLLAAQGRLTVPAQCAAALNAGIQRLLVAGGLVSFRSVVESENYGHAFANFVPGLLEHTDLPDILAQSQVRKAILAGMLDGTGRRLPVEEVQKIYERTRGLEVLEQAAWNIETLVKTATVS